MKVFFWLESGLVGGSWFFLIFLFLRVGLVSHSNPFSVILSRIFVGCLCTQFEAMVVSPHEFLGFVRSRNN